MTFVRAFVVGGLLCAIAQVILDYTRVNPAIIMVSAACAGAVLSGLGLYGQLVNYAGAGATVPLFGFGHTLVQGMLEDAAKEGWFGVFTGGFRAAGAALTGAVVFGYLMAVLFNPKG